MCFRTIMVTLLMFFSKPNLVLLRARWIYFVFVIASYVSLVTIENIFEITCEEAIKREV